jgi:hypothetical protein
VAETTVVEKSDHAIGRAETRQKPFLFGINLFGEYVSHLSMVTLGRL